MPKNSKLCQKIKVSHIFLFEGPQNEEPGEDEEQPGINGTSSQTFHIVCAILSGETFLRKQNCAVIVLSYQLS